MPKLDWYNDQREDGIKVLKTLYSNKDGEADWGALYDRIEYLESKLTYGDEYRDE